MGVHLRPEPADNAVNFPTTRWSLISLARDQQGVTNAAHPDRQTSRQQTALATLLARYRPALEAHLLSKSIDRSRAEDFVQGFITERILERNLLQHADEARGRFRSFLLACLDNYVANRFRFETASKRAPSSGKLMTLADDHETANGCHPKACDNVTADIFDVTWAREALAEGLRRMRIDCEASGRGDLWEMFRLRVVDHALYDAPPLGYAEMVERFGYRSPKQAANALVTAKRRFVAALRSVMAEYVDNEEELDREIGSLGAVLASPCARTVASNAPNEASPLRWAANDEK